MRLQSPLSRLTFSSLAPQERRYALDVSFAEHPTAAGTPPSPSPLIPLANTSAFNTELQRHSTGEPRCACSTSKLHNLSKGPGRCHGPSFLELLCRLLNPPPPTELHPCYGPSQHPLNTPNAFAVAEPRRRPPVPICRLVHLPTPRDMSQSLSAPRVLLLAVHLATKSDVEGLAALATQHPAVLHTDLLLRVILTCLPETLPSAHYVSLIQRIQTGSLAGSPGQETVDDSSVQDISDAEAVKKVRKLKLLPLAWDDAPDDARNDSFALFLLHRAHRVDEEAGLLTQLPELVAPFLDHAPCVRSWAVSTLLPLLRRNYEYYPDEPIHLTLSAFERLDDRSAATLILSQTGLSERDLAHIGRDLRGLIGPWLHDRTRWSQTGPRSQDTEAPEDGASGKHCPGWEQVLEWLVTQATRSWRVAIKAVDQWDGPGDVDLGAYGNSWLDEEEQSYLERRYARAILAAAYSVPEPTIDALSDVNKVISKVMSLLDQDACPTLGVASSLLPPFLDDTGILCPQNATHMRNHQLSESNPLTTPGETQTQLLHTLTLSAYILTKAGAPCTVRRAGELAFLQDEREQKAEAVRFISSLGQNGPKNDDKYWIRARNELLWLRDWGADEASDEPSPQSRGVFGQLEKEFLEIECLKAFLSHSRGSSATPSFEASSNISQGTLLPDRYTKRLPHNPWMGKSCMTTSSHQP